MKKSKGVISLILTVVLIALLGFTTIVGFGKTGSGAAKNIKLGLDLEGGVSITYQVKGDKPSQSDMDDTIYKLQRRVEQYSTEATVYQEGDDRISIEIPGVKDANKILDELGQPVPCILSGRRTVKAMQTTVWIPTANTNWTRQLKSCRKTAPLF